MRKVYDFWDSLRDFNQLEIMGQAMGFVEIDDPKDWYWEKYVFPFNKLYFIEKGGIRADLYDDDEQICKTVEFLPGHVYLIPCGTMVTLSTGSGFRKAYVHMNIPMSDGYDLFYGIHDIFEKPFAVEQLLEKQKTAYEDPFSYAVYIRSVVCSVITELLYDRNLLVMKERLYSVSHYPKELLSAIRYIRSSVDARMTVTEIAHRCGISPSVLSELFKENLHITPKKYMNERLYERSCALLLGTDRSIKEIACDLHFSTPFAFSKFFKTNGSRSPDVYRKHFKQ